MTRSVHALLALVAVVGTSVAVTGCNSPNCGKGTKQVQQPDGTLTCQLAEVPKQLIQCDDVDGGTSVIVGGKCQSHIKCDPLTTGYDPVSGICVGTGGGTGDCPVCKQPGPGKICVTGNVYDFSTGLRIKKGDKILRIGAYEPLAFLANPATDPLQETVDSNGCYTFPDITTPGSGLVAVATADAKGTVPQAFELTGAGAIVVSGKIYKVDVYATPVSVVDGWKTQTGKNWDATGAYIALYYDKAVPDPTDLRIDAETMPAMGVQIVDGPTVVTTGNYFAPGATTLSTTLMATGAFGGAAIPATGNITTYSGLDVGCTAGTCTKKWEHHLGASTAHVLFIDRYHNCTLSPTAATCQ